MNAYANEIDDLKSDTDVKKFMTSFFSKKYPGRLKGDWFKSSDSLQLKVGCDSFIRYCTIINWGKFDFNVDGATDLFIMIGNEGNVIMDNGKNGFNWIEVPDFFNLHCHLTIPFVKNKRAFLLYYSDHVSYNQDKEKKDSFAATIYSDIDTLLYRNNNFIELSHDSSELQIKSIKFKYMTELSFCPDIDLYLLQDSNKNEYSIYYDDRRRGISKAILTNRKVQELASLFNYMNILKLKNSYWVTWTDAGLASLEIVFNDGSIKNIQDWGMQGTFGLRAVYRYFIALWESLVHEAYCK